MKSRNRDPITFVWTLLALGVGLAILLSLVPADAYADDYRVRWTSPAENETRAITHWMLQRGPGCSRLDEVDPLDLGLVIADDSGIHSVILEFNELTRITVTAVNSVGESDPSNCITIRPDVVVTQKPLPATGLRAERVE